MSICDVSTCASFQNKDDAVPDNAVPDDAVPDDAVPDDMSEDATSDSDTGITIHFDIKR